MKKFIFFASLFLIPLLFLSMAELSLRLLSYGTSYPLFKQEGDWIVINSQYPKLFFGRFDAAAPELIEHKFRARKESNTVRIVCLGGSTTAGFPFEININFPVFLQCFLQNQFPHKKWQVINLGISAVNSQGVRFMVPEVLKLHPDLILIYMGHNEFYGVFGPASAQGVFSNPLLVQGFLRLKHWRIYQLLEEIIYRLGLRKTSSGTTLMARTIKHNHVPFNGPLYKKTLRHFQRNLSAILQTFKEKNIPVVLSPLVSNLKDQPPLGADASQIPWPDLPALQRALEREDFGAAKTMLKQALKQFPQNALLHFLLGKVYYHFQNFELAKKHFALARDYDPIPFRAPSAINQIIRHLAGQYHLELAPTDSLFGRYSKHGIYDNTLFLEHLHPNEKGYWLMAHAFARRVSSILRANPHWSADPSCAHYTELDLAIGEQKIVQLVAQAPFNGKSGFSARTFDPPLIHELANRHNKKQLLWDAAHFQLGDYYLAHDLMNKALREYHAVLAYDSTHLTALARIGDAYFKERKFDLARQYYQKAAALHPGATFVKAKLAQTQFLLGNVARALNVINRITSHPLWMKQLDRQQQVALRYLQAVSLARLGRTQEARKVLRSVLSLAPEFKAARQLAEQLKQKEE